MKWFTRMDAITRIPDANQGAPRLKLPEAREAEVPEAFVQHVCATEALWVRRRSRHTGLALCMFPDIDSMKLCVLSGPRHRVRGSCLLHEGAAAPTTGSQPWEGQRRAATAVGVASARTPVVSKVAKLDARFGGGRASGAGPPFSITFRGARGFHNFF